MNKGKENYQNIPLPDGLSDAVQKGLKKGRRHMEKKWITAIGTLAAACVLGFVVLKVLPDNLRTPQENAPSAQSRLASPQDGQTPEAAAYSAEEDPSGASPASMGTPSEDSSEAAVQEAAPSSIRVSGTVAQIDEEGRILLENKEEGAAYPQVLLNVTDDTLILSGADCSEKALSDIAVGDILYADISPAMTRSLPPIANAFTLFCEISEDAAVPVYGTITDVSFDGEGGLRITTDQDLILNTTEDAPVLSLDNSQTLSASALMAGDTILIQYSFMTMSIPAQTNPDEIRLVAKAPVTAAQDPTSDAVSAASSIRVSGTVTQIENGQILLKNEEEGAAYPQILLNITDDTLILSGADCSEKTLSDIAEGDILYADISPAMTRSIPPMANAFVVFCETQEDTTVPTYAVITDIQTSEDGQTTIITDQDLVLLPGTDTKILSLEGNSALPLSDLNIGDAILARFSIMTASLPAQASPDSIWVIGQEAAAVEIE